jgi:site-specific DNA recombinase
MQTAVIYCRVSDTEQVDGTSLASQERLCREYAQREGMHVLKVFIDAGESAKTADRPEFNKALLLCRRQKVSYFVVYKLDRFARNQDDHVMVRTVLRRNGTALRSVTEPINETPTGRMMEGMLSAFAEFDNNVRTERTKQGMLERVQQGVWVWPAPLGYRRTHRGSNIVPDPQMAPFIKQAFEDYSTGAYSFERLAHLLAEKGLRSKFGNILSNKRIQETIANPVYCGIISVWGEQFEGTFPPLISKELFATCQLQRFSVHAMPRSCNNALFPLRGFVECEQCRTTLTGSCSTGGSGIKHPYYHHYHRDCSLTRSVPKRFVEERFIDFLKELEIAPNLATILRHTLIQVYKEMHGDRRRQAAAAQRELTLLKADRQRLFELHRSGTYSDDEFLEQKRLVEQRIYDKSLLLTNEKTGYNFEAALQNYFERFADPATLWLKLAKNYPDRIAFQRQILPTRLRFDSKQLRTDTFPLSYQLKRAAESGTSDVVALVTQRWNELLRELR